MDVWAFTFYMFLRLASELILPNANLYLPHSFLLHYRSAAVLLLTILDKNVDAKKLPIHFIKHLWLTPISLQFLQFSSNR